MTLETFSQQETGVEQLGIELTTASAGLAVVIILLGFFANRISNIFIDRAIESRSGDKHAAVTAKKTSAYVIYILTFVAVLAAFGVSPSALGAAVGLIGLGLSFALKDMISNFISGLMIMVNRPFKIGDQIDAEGEIGKVEDIRIRATDVKTFDGRKVIIPNSKLYNNTVINNTAYNNRRFDVVVGISYSDDIKKAKELAKETLEEAETVEEDPEPQVLVDELGGSSVNLKLRGWTDTGRASIVAASSEITHLVKDKFNQNDIEIPFPIRTIYMEE